MKNNKDNNNNNNNNNNNSNNNNDNLDSIEKPILQTNDSYQESKYLQIEDQRNEEMKKYLNNKTINETNDSVNENNNENNNMNLDFDLDSNNKLGIDNSKNNTRNNVNHKIKIDETINTKSVINNYLFTFQNENKLLKTVDLSNFKIKKLKLTKCIIHKNIKTYLHPYIIIKINYKTNLNYLYKNEHN